MTRHVKASTMAPSTGKARLGAVVLAVAALTLLAFAPASQAKVPVDGFGSFFNGGFGTVPGGSFVFGSPQAIAASGGVSEVETVTVGGGASGGSFTLSFGSTAPTSSTVSFGASAAQVQSGLEAIGDIGAGNVEVTEPSSGTYEVEFIGSKADANQPALVADASSLTPSGTVTVATVHDGVASGTLFVADGNRIQRLSASGAFERAWGLGVGASPGAFGICTVAADCQAGFGTGPGGQAGIGFNGVTALAVSPASGDVFAWAGNARIVEFDPDGNFVRTWGWDVVRSGRPNDSGTGFEICDATAGDAVDGSDCQSGSEGENGGQLWGGGAGGVVVDSSGHVWVADGANRRVQEFDETGHFIAAYGYNVGKLGSLESCNSTAAGACGAGTQGTAAGQFSAGSPTSIAFDSSGSLYAIDAGNHRVQKFNAGLTTASTFAAPTFAAYTSQGPERVLATRAGARLLFSLDNTVTASPGEHQIIELDPSNPGTATDTSLAGAGLQSVTGLAVSGNAPGAAIYATTTDTENSPSPILVLGDPLPPIAPSMNDVTSKTDTTAILTATVDPLGGWVRECAFEYSTDQSNWTSLEAPACSSLDNSGGAQTVSQEATGLTPNQQYYVRFRAARPLTPDGTVTTTVKSFDTQAVPPIVTDVGATEISDTSVRLVGAIDPRNSATSYVFEYGSTPALGSSTQPLAIGTGTTPIVVSQVIGGLSPDTTYYFQLAATNPPGTTTSTLKTVHTRATPLPLPAQRRWEMVTPPDKNYGDADKVATYSPDVVGAAPDGNSVGFCTTALFGDPPGRMTQFCAPYMSRRTPTGWETGHPFPEYCRTDPVTGIGGGRLTVSVSRDFSRFVDKVSESEGCPGQPIDPNAPLDEENREGVASNLYVQNPATDPFEYHLLNTASPDNHPPDDQAASNRFVGGSSDFSHVVYVSGANQTAPPDSPAPGNFQKVYQWEEQGENGCALPSGCLSLVSKDTNGTPFTSGSGVPTFCCLGATAYVNPSAVSADGSRVFFANPFPGASNTIYIEGSCAYTPACELYMREDAATTFDVSESECTLGAACGSPQEKSDYFLYATPSAADAFFVSCAKLTDSASPQGCGSEVNGWGAGGIGGGTNGSKLYRWRRGAAAGHHLVDVTEDDEPSDGAQPDFKGLVGASDDGDTVYFVTSGQIVAGEPTGAGEKIYRWRWNEGAPTVDYLGPYQALSSSSAEDVNTFGTRRMVTPDGKHLMLYTALRLDPAADHDSDSDVYRWDESDGWQCVSCQQPGVPSAGGIDLEEAYLKYSETLDPAISNLAPRVFMSDDGQRIFFGTPDALVPEDVNGETGCPRDSLQLFGSQQANLYTCEDVYEWHDGTVGLISSGTGAVLSRIIAASDTGNDVFFYTGQRLVGWDTDDNIDIYDARVGGGFPEPPAQPAACEGESCRGASPAAAGATGAGTAVFQGPGDPPAKHHAPRKRHKKKTHKHRHKRSRAANHHGRVGR